MALSDKMEPSLHPFDRLHHTDTSGFLPGSDLATGHRHDAYNTAYYGMAPSRFQTMLDRWQAGVERSIEEYTFLDLGCGKGRALLLAARHPFRKVIGIELHAGLAKIAKQNARLWQHKGYARAPIRIACEDATEVRLPVGACLLYLFHPFEVPAMTSLIRNLDEQLTRRNATLDILYFNPDAGAVLEAQAGFQLQWSASLSLSEEEREADPLMKEGDLCNMYRWVGDGTKANSELPLAAMSDPG